MKSLPEVQPSKFHPQVIKLPLRKPRISLINTYVHHIEYKIHHPSLDII